MFWVCIGKGVMDFNVSFEDGELRPSQKQAVITLIEKKKKIKIAAT